MLAGGVAAASNVFVFQSLYFSGAPATYLFFIGLLAFVSGVLLAGSFGHSVLEVVLQARPVRITTGGEGKVKAPSVGKDKTAPLTFKLAITSLLILLLAGGAIYYFAAVFEPPWVGPPLPGRRVSRKKTLSFHIDHFNRYETTITAELQGQVTYVPPKQYTGGVPLRVILQEAVRLDGGAKKSRL